MRVAAGRAFLFLGFTRPSDPKILENKHRNLILDIITSDQGINATSIAKRVPEAGWSTVIYHLAVLEKHGLIRSAVDGRHRRFFLLGTPSGVQAAASALKNDRTRRVLQLVKDRPGVARAPLAKQVGVTVPAVLWHIERLRAAGLLRAERSGRTILYYPC